MVSLIFIVFFPFYGFIFFIQSFISIFFVLPLFIFPFLSFFSFFLFFFPPQFLFSWLKKLSIKENKVCGHNTIIKKYNVQNIKLKTYWIKFWSLLSRQKIASIWSRGNLSRNLSYITIIFSRINIPNENFKF